MIGDQIKALRKEKRLSQQVFAAMLGTSSGYVSEIEQGKKTPGGEFFFSLKRVFDVDLNQFFVDQGQADGGVHQVVNGNGNIQVGGDIHGRVSGGNKTVNEISPQHHPPGVVEINKVLRILKDYLAPKVIEEIKEKLKQ